MRFGYVFEDPTLLCKSDTRLIFRDASHGERESDKEITVNVKYH